MKIQIKPHLDYPTTHSVVIVEHRARMYACAWAGVPTMEEAVEAWKTDRRVFRPYNTATGRY